MEPITKNKAFAYPLLFIGVIALLVAFTGCNSHPSIIGGRGHHGTQTVVPSATDEPKCNDTDGDDCPTCPVCGKKDHKHGHTNNGHHYGQFKHHANG